MREVSSVNAGPPNLTYRPSLAATVKSHNAVLMVCHVPVVPATVIGYIHRPFSAGLTGPLPGAHDIHDLHRFAALGCWGRH